MAKTLTLEEMAAELRFTPKTLRKYIALYKIPHAGLGRDLRFRSEEVWEHLKLIQASTAAVDQPSKLKPEKLKRQKTKRSPSSERYTQLLGLEGVY